MKNITLSAFLSSLLVVLLISLISCEKKFDDVEVGNKLFEYSNSIPLTNQDDIELSLIYQDSINNIYSKIRRFLDNLSLNYNSSDVPMGLVLYYNNIIDTNSFNNVTAVLYYYKNNGDKAKLWCKENGILTLDQGYSKMNHFVSNLDIYRIDQIKGLNSVHVLLLLDQHELPVSPNFSEFQTKIDKDYALAPKDPPGDGGPHQYERYCNQNPDCEEFPWRGTCYWKESQTAFPEPKCNTLGTPDGECKAQKVNSILIQNNIHIDTSFIPNMYYIRNEVLLNDNKYENLIDDYYYASSIIASDITLSIALDVYSLSNTNFIDILKNYNNANYSDSVLIKSTNKPILLSICNKCKNLTSDTKVNSIFNNLINLVNTYENKTISYIKSN